MTLNVRDTVIFLGAGFSCDSGLPTMEKFGPESKTELKALRKFLCDYHSNNLKKINKCNDCGKFAAPMLCEAGEVFHKFCDFCKLANDYINVKIDNMETIFCIAESMQEAEIKPIKLNQGNIHDHDIDHLIEKIKLWLWKIYHKCPALGNSQKAAPYEKFLNLIKQNNLSKRLTIITTNYDLVFEYFAWKSGIPCKYPISSYSPFPVGNHNEKFLAEDNLNSASILCKMHGSINYFHLQHDSNNLFISEDIAKAGDQIGKSYIRSDRPAIFAVDAINKLREEKQTIIPAIIPPTYAKLNRFSWLKETWKEASCALQDAKHLVFIGYSMPISDGFMRALLQGAFAKRRKKKDLIVYVFDPEAKDDTDTGRIYNTLFSPLKNKNLKLIPQTFEKAMGNELMKLFISL